MAFRIPTPEDFRELLFRLLPPGPAWSRAQGTRLAALFLAIGDEFERVSEDAAALLDESDFSTTDELLEAWERVFGLPDDCTPDPTTDPDERRAILHGKATASGGQSPAYYNEIADRVTGEACDVTEYSGGVFTAGDEVGEPLLGANWGFWWAVSIPNVEVTHMPVGEPVGEPLAVYPAFVTELACILDKARPSHANFFFEYPDDDPDT